MTLTLPEPLNQLGAEEAAVLMSLAETVRFPAGARIFEEGAPGDGFYLIEDGQVRIELERPGIDAEAVLGFLPAGSILGELSLLDRMPRSASAYAHTDVKARRMAADVFERQRDEHPRLYAGLLAILGRSAAQKLRQTNEVIADAMFSPMDPEVDATVARALTAQQQFQDWPEEKVEAILRDLAGAVAMHAEEFASASVKYTGVGNVRDKTLKNKMSSIGVYQSLAGRPGAGLMSRDEQRKVSELASPVGVVFAIIPMTNPIATAIFKTLICLKGRNALILSFHRSTAGVGGALVDLLRDVLNGHGAPLDVVQIVKHRVSRKTTAMYMRHPKVSLILATGGASMVKAAYSSGTPAIGVGPGNAPAFVCADADIEHAADSILMSKTFDNGLVCGSEHNLVVDAGAREALVEGLVKRGAAVLTKEEVARFTERVVDAPSKHIRTELVGKSATEIAAAAAIARDYPIQLIVVPAEGASEENPYALEKMAPIVSLFTVADDEEGFEVCRKLLTIEGAGHTAIIHTRRPELAARFGAEMPASRILVNSPGSHGVIGYTTGLVPSLTLGCGTFGKTSTTDNVSYTHLLNIKRVAEFLPPTVQV
jgi:acetaldehyde dehydrogenase / alcohol dehydrogenase